MSRNTIVSDDVVSNKPFRSIDSMKSICFSFNHLQLSDGIARSAIGLANYLVNHYETEVILRPIYKNDIEVGKMIDKRVIIRPVFGFYFPGMSIIIKIIPKKVLHRFIFGNDKYDIEVGFQHGTSTISAVFHKPNSNSKHIVWMHGYDEGLTMLPYFEKADIVVCVSQYNADRLRDESNGIIKPEYAYNLIDEKRVCSDGEMPILERRSAGVVFISVGRHSKEKGYKRLIESVSQLVDSGYSLELWLVGDGPEHQSLIDLVKVKKLTKSVRFMGAQTNPHKYTSKADVFICSSFSEGYSTACTEAIMLGIPVLTTDVSGAAEIIGAAEAGAIVDNSQTGLTMGMKTILDNPVLIEKWKNTLQQTKNKFSQDNRASKIVKIFDLQ